ncbi:inositol-pentakisphosphate 2-kinase-domain-containing protein [Tribonema minus]|uniref:Inositol-pentakisphosphate 2-kinase n=1 Tax=Tribonema minus TaxID=303371 RepID=A0A836CJM7_9STRA|nr:inositol-pentakisphosphate 2-kinase-domain-containing protein [Tribonema minus]
MPSGGGQQVAAVIVSAAAAGILVALLLSWRTRSRRHHGGPRLAGDDDACGITGRSSGQQSTAVGATPASAVAAASAPTQLDVDVTEWTYVAEGNATIVLRRCQIASAPGVSLCGRSILRISKTHAAGEVSPESHHVQTVCVPLFGAQYIDAGETVLLETETVRELEAQIEHARPPGRLAGVSASPAVRLDGDGSKSRHSSGVLARDLTSMWLPRRPCACTMASTPAPQCAAASGDSNAGASLTLSLEIKPKCGVMPRSLLIPAGTGRQLKYRISRFDALQRFKLGTERLGWGVMEAATAYSPPDMYSGDAVRIGAALHALVARPNNYLKLYSCGAAVPLEKKAAHGETGDGGGDKPPQQQQQPEPLSAKDKLSAAAWHVLGMDVDALLGAVAAVLEREPLLQRIHALQRLDVLDVAGAHMVHQRLVALCGGADGAAAEEVQRALIRGTGWRQDAEWCAQWLEAWRGVLFVEHPEDLSAEELDALHAHARAAVEQLTQQQCSVLLAFWHVAQAAADCSIMVTLSAAPRACAAADVDEVPLQSGWFAGEVEVADGAARQRRLLYCLSAMDTGPKPPTQLSKQCKREPLVWQFIATEEEAQSDA